MKTIGALCLLLLATSYVTSLPVEPPVDPPQPSEPSEPAEPSNDDPSTPDMDTPPLSDEDFENQLQNETETVDSEVLQTDWDSVLTSFSIEILYPPTSDGEGDDNDDDDSEVPPAPSETVPTPSTNLLVNDPEQSSGEPDEPEGPQEPQPELSSLLLPFPDAFPTSSVNFCRTQAIQYAQKQRRQCLAQRPRPHLPPTRPLLCNRSYNRDLRSFERRCSSCVMKRKQMLITCRTSPRPNVCLRNVKAEFARCVRFIRFH
jgi:hypothetical protein